MMKYRYLTEDEKRQIARQLLRNMTLDEIEMLLLIVDEYLNIQQRTESILRRAASLAARTTPSRRTLEDIIAQMVEKEMEKREKIPTPPPEEIEKREQERTQFQQELRKLIERIRQEKTKQEQRKLKQDLETLKDYGVLDKHEYEELKKKLNLEEETEKETKEKENQKTG